MSQGYYAIKTIVFHNLDDRNNYVEENPSVIAISRKEAQRFHKEIKEPFYCGSCGQYHEEGRVYKESIKDKVNPNG